MAKSSKRKRAKEQPDTIAILTRERDAKAAEKAGTVSTGEKSEFRESGETASLEADTEEQQTEEDLLKFFKVDTRIWEVADKVCGRHKVSAYNRTANEWQDRLLWNTKLKLKRRIAKPVSDGIEWITEKFRKCVSPKFKPPKAVGSCLLEQSIFDLHVGRYSWSAETGTDWDADIVQRVYANAASDLLARVKGWPVAKILLPFGSDFFHVNNWSNTTVNNTPQDVDTRMPRVFGIGFSMLVANIERCRRAAPVRVVWVPGNHDRETSFYVCFALKQYFRECPDVEIDISPPSRKYQAWGINLIGFAHGDEEKHDSLPTIMAGEVPELWGKSKQREIHVGHFHKAKETKHVNTDEFGGVRVRILPSLSGADAWHARRGYVNSRRSAEAYLWDEEQGYVGHFSVNARE